MFRRSLAHYRKKSNVTKEQRSYSRHAPFCDRVKTLVSSGTGGDGANVMLSLMNNEFAGPGGGNGGRGGNVFVKCSSAFQDLAHVSMMGSQISAGLGSIGFGDNSRGRNGVDLELELPLGTQVVDVDTNELVCDLDDEESVVLLLEGGQGGKGNAVFKSYACHSPKHATKGLPGNTMLAQFELKMMADCGLVGFPNAGKSTLLGAVSTSKPKIAPYPFTTLHPYIGVMNDIVGNTCRVADLPGLIEGAFENRGLGHQFLRHVERTQFLAYVLDMNEAYVPGDRQEPQEPWEVLETLKYELEYYLPGLSERGVMVFANKMDELKDPDGISTRVKLEELRRRSDIPIFSISAKNALKHGCQHASSGELMPAMNYLCGKVFERKRRMEDERRESEANDERELDSVYFSRHRGIFGGKDGSLQSANVGSSSLVDQQLDNVGGSGYGDAFDAYRNLPGQGQLHKLRDMTLGNRGYNQATTSSAGSTFGKNEW